jgi:hypothetical protein
MPFYQKVVGHLDPQTAIYYRNKTRKKKTGYPEIAAFLRQLRGGTNDNDLWMKKIGMSLHYYRSCMPRTTLRGAIVAAVVPRQVAGKKKSSFLSNSVRLLRATRKRTELP